MRSIKTYIEFVNEDVERYSEAHPRYIETEYQSKNNDGKQRILNKKDSIILSILRYIFESGKEGRSYTEIQRFYYEISLPGHEYNSTRDRGRGSTMFSGGDYPGRPTGILHAYCKKNDNKKWVLTDDRLLDVFEYMDYKNETNPSEDDMWLLKDLGIFGLH